MFVYDITNQQNEVKQKNCIKGVSSIMSTVCITITAMTLTRGKFPPFCLLAGSCWTRSNIRYSENTATQNMAPPHTVTCFLSFILLRSGLLSKFTKKKKTTGVFPAQKKQKKKLESNPSQCRQNAGK